MPRIFIACHADKIAMPRVAYGQPLQTGACDKPAWPGHLRDDAGDNISGRNRSYGEHTGLYWVWRNTNEPLTGWCHYRRFFSPVLFPDSVSTARLPLQNVQNLLDRDPAGHVFDLELALADIILPRAFDLAMPVSAQYRRFHRGSDWDAMIAMIHDLYPDEGGPAAAYFDTATALHAACLFIARRAALDGFCQWLFPLLARLEEVIVPPEDAYQCRVFSYLAERLFNWWVVSRRLRVTTRPVMLVGG